MPTHKILVDVHAPSIGSDGTAKSYTWTVPNTSSNNQHWYKIARVTGSQSQRFKLQMVGGYSYSDNHFASEVNVYGQLNNDNNYDLVFYQLEKSGQTSSPVLGFGQVDVDDVSTDLYVKLANFAELAITASVSKGDIYPEATSTSSTSEPTNFVAATEQFSVLSEAHFAGNVLISSNLQHINDDNNEISFGTDTQDFRTNNVSRLDISNSGVRLGGTGARITQVEDNDSLGTSDTKLATQGNVKAYVDARTGTNITSVGTLSSVTVSGNINANGNIVGDDSTSITNIDSIQLDNVMADADTTTRIGLSSTSMEFLVADSDVMDLNETTLNVSGTLVAKKHKLAKTSNTDGNADGDIVYFGATTSMDTGKIYYFNSSGNWALADADAESTAKGMLGVALGAASDTNGVLIRGMVTLDTDPGTIGDTLFLSTTAGVATSTAPSGNGDIVRVIGYCLDSTNGQIYFNPDGTFVEVTA
tara:strand:- start:95 stop:1516 length:1422 start_codon:yes stop_codon:yes gene_type:complete